jgi:hypothetical protein
VLHDEANSYVKNWRKIETNWSQEAMITSLYNANASGNPPYTWRETPCWLQQGYNVIANCLHVDAVRNAAKAAAHG